MSLSKYDVETLINRKSETPNVDYKRGFIWNASDKHDSRLGIIKDILAMSNTKDGGVVIFGVDDTYSLDGLTPDEFRSFDPTKINDLVKKYSDPQAKCNIYKYDDIQGKRVVAIEVPEFTDLPIICKKNAGSNINPSDLILKESQLYIRSSRAASEAISSPQEMRDLLSRGLTRKSDELLENIERLLRGKPKIAAESDIERYGEEIKSATQYIEEHIGEELKDKGYLEVIAYPTSFQENRIADKGTVGDLIQKADVSLRGWNFPHIDRENLSNFLNGKQSYTAWLKHYEAWRLYQSGLFVWHQVFREDSDEAIRQKGKVLSFVSAIYSLTEFLTFLKRLYADEMQVDSIHVQISLHGCRGRRLISLDPAVELWDDYRSEEDLITVSADVQIAELKAFYKELATQYIKQIFEIFNWENVPDQTIESWQNRLIERKI